ncbi:hypothetical protein LUZ61_008972 [Rhynchospora tenuis]|uniref:NB-ARC domain-containing protein n=1 Tax=Rhynchospora tenuis TaxID=198213 RepID=A0AAD6EXW5_9POAL|nr:hypothetical protein LUZ61_008972 [Rhynchospora tenuis]
MTGFGETVGGWFGSSIVGKMLDMVGSYLGKNNALESATAEMLASLKDSLPQIEYAIVEARKMPPKNPALIKCLDNLTNAAYEVKDVLDDFEAKRNREKLMTKNMVTESESIATKIGEKLHGLPLAGRVIGKMLYNKLDKSQWEKTLKNNLWDDESTSEQIFASLSIGYNDLDPDVQQCFKFCSIFPKHYVFDRNTLVQMWLAHDFDFVQPNGGETFKLNTKEIKLEDIGGERFDKLVERSFFQATVNNGKYVMHDLIRELAIAVSRKEEFYYVNRLDDKISNVITRHMGINCDGSNREEINPIYSNLRTMILFGNWIRYSGKLTNLQELEEFRIGKSDGHRISELRDMNEISGHLRLTYLQNVTSKEEAATCQLAKKSYLKSLELTFSYNKIKFVKGWHDKLELEVLEALKPSPSVEMLTISGVRGGSLPGWMWSTQSGLFNIKCITVTVSFCSLTTLPAFGELPYLEVLMIFMGLSDLKMVGDEFYGRSDVVFPSLKELQFSGMSSWRTWSDAPAEKKSFPVLKKITLERCRVLKEMPTNIFTSSMVELKLLTCPIINNIETILPRIAHLTQLSITGCCNNLSINCTALRFLEVLCLGDVINLYFVGGLKSLVNLRKLELTGFNKVLESFEKEEENDGTYQENRLLTSLNLDYYCRSPPDYCNPLNRTGILPLAGRLGYLRSLLISNSPVTEYTEVEESYFSQLTSLENLTFAFFRQLRCLPSTLPLLTKLKKLTIKNCPKISSLPESGLPPSLTELYITGCSDELVCRCQPDQGDDWCKISHIPHEEDLGVTNRYTFDIQDQDRNLYHQAEVVLFNGNSLYDLYTHEIWLDTEGNYWQISY